MRTIINYIRSCFCTHDWECLARTSVYSNKEDTIPDYHVWTYRCKKCGYSKKYKSH